MNSSIFKTTLFGALLLLGGQVQAITINDAGVVGTIWHCGDAVEAGATPDSKCSSADSTSETAMAQYLLDMGINSTVTADGNGDGYYEDYETGANDYSGILVFAEKDDSGDNTGFDAYEYVLGKYDGPNAGYILYNVADYVAAYGSAIPMLPAPIWGNSNDTGLALSHWVGFNRTSVPAPGAAFLLGLGLIGLVGMRKKIS